MSKKKEGQYVVRLNRGASTDRTWKFLLEVLMSL